MGRAATPPVAIALVAMVAVEPIEHNGKLYEPGAELEVEQHQADDLVAIGAALPKQAELVPPPPPAPPQP